MTTTLTSRPQAATCDLGLDLARFDADALVRAADYRRAVTRVDPLAFALIYLPHHLRGEEIGSQITLCESHLDLIEQANTGSCRMSYLRSTVTPTLLPRPAARAPGGS